MMCQLAFDSVIFSGSAACLALRACRIGHIAGKGAEFHLTEKGSFVSKGLIRGASVYAARCPFRQRSRSCAVPSMSVKKSGDSGADSGISSLFCRALLLIFPAIENSR